MKRKTNLIIQITLDFGGFACVIAAGFLLHPIVGLLVLGGFAFLLSSGFKKSMEEEKRKENDDKSLN